jgi:hypothetical protein
VLEFSKSIDIPIVYNFLRLVLIIHSMYLL